MEESEGPQQGTEEARRQASVHHHTMYTFITSTQAALS